MKRMLNSSKHQAMQLVSSYPQSVIDYVNEFREAASNLEVYEFQCDNLVKADPAEELAELRREYVYPAMHEGIFKSAAEFDALASALDSISPIG